MNLPTVPTARDLDETHLRHAIALGRSGMTSGCGGPFGACIVRDGTVVGEGCNRVTSTNDPTAHAEVVAIRNACSRLTSFTLTGCTLYTSCEPCPMCLAAAHWARIEAIVYGASRQDAARAGFDDALLYREIVLPPSRRIVPARRRLAREATALFDEWLAKPDRLPY